MFIYQQFFCMTASPNFFIFQFGSHLYFDGGIIITFSVVTSSGCKTMLIIDWVNLGTGRRNCFFVTALIILLPRNNKMKSVKTHPS